MGGSTGRLTPIDREHLSIGQSDIDQAPTAESRIVPVNNPEHQTCCDGRIDRIATLPHRLHGSPSRQGMDRRGSHVGRQPIGKATEALVRVA
jgi:hypothetical protein